MKNFNNNLEKRIIYFNKIGPSIAQEMSKALQTLTIEPIEVKFDKVQTFEQSTLFIDVGEKCFGSHVIFKSSPDSFEGIALAVFPLSSTKILIELLLERYLKKLDNLTIDHKMKLSAFKEALNILLLTFLTGIANALKIKLKMNVPKFASFQNIEFVRPDLFKKYPKIKGLISVGQFNITSREKDKEKIKCGLLLIY